MFLPYLTPYPFLCISWDHLPTNCYLSSASEGDLDKTESMHMLRGRNIQRSSFARVPDGSWRGEMKDTRGSGGENGVYCSSHILLSKPFMEVVPANEAGWMNTDPIVCTHGDHMETLSNG